MESSVHTLSKQRKTVQKPLGREREVEAHPAAASWLGDEDSSLFRYGHRVRPAPYRSFG